KMKEVQTLSARIVRERIDKAFRTRVVYEGVAKYMKPNLALLDLHRREKPTEFEKFVCTGTYLFEYNQQAKQIRYHELQSKPGQVADDNFLSFLFGMRAEDAKKRYDISLFREDVHYHYFKILPRRAEDKADFQVAYLVLARNTFLPRMLIFDDPGGNRTTWDV